LLSNHAAGIGDHSTEDFYKNAHEALAALTDADDKIETLNKYSFTIVNGKNVTTKK
jgi:ABC-type tungstate transport system permease subunit